MARESGGGIEGKMETATAIERYSTDPKMTCTVQKIR